VTCFPELRVEHVRRAYDDGAHDAFTDLCRFAGRLYLTCRSCPDGHMVFASAQIVVLSSPDGIAWEPVFRFSVPARDTRDPHFLVFNERLYVLTGTWLVPPTGGGRSLNEHLGYGAWSADGRGWNGPTMLEGTYGHYIWRAAAWNGRAYLCGRRRRGFAAGVGDESLPESIESAMLVSDDGLVWSRAALFTEDYGDETAFVFERDGRVVALARGADGRPARLCSSRPPFGVWTRTDLDRNVGGPLLACWSGRYLVGGRRTLDGQPRTVLSWLDGSRLRDVAELPSAGDNSYPGFVQLDASRALLSYYSSHEGSTSVYLADLRLG
jgi:hypothetical protein